MAKATLFLPEITALLSALVLFVLALSKTSANARHRISVGLAGLVLASSIATFGEVGEPFFPGIYTVDVFSQLFRLVLALGLFLVTLVCGELSTVRQSARADIPMFLFISTAGMMMLVSATELLTLYVALELSAYSLFVLVALHRAQRRGAEAGIKYLVYGAAASAVTLYGLSLVFGMAGSTYVADIVLYAAGVPTAPLFVVGIVLTLSGFLFKLAVFPFHSWAPDTYEGAPHPVATFVGTVSKVAAVGALIRVCTLIPAESGQMPAVFFVLAVASMTFGNLAALAQKDLKRLLGYSTIAHAGYILVGLYALSEVGIASAIFYAVIYLAIAFGAFLVICVLGRDGTNPTFDSIAGLYRRSPFLALVLLVSMFGLAGIPPTAGFAGKWFLFAAALEKGQLLLVLIAAVNATISLYYYLQVIRAAYLFEPKEETPIEMSSSLRLGAILALLLIFLSGVWPGPLWELSLEAARAVLPG